MEDAAARTARPGSSRFARLTALDLSYLHTESPAWPAHYSGLGILEGGPLLDSSGRLRLAEIRERLDRRLTRAPLLRRRLHVPGWGRGRPLWVDDGAFAIEHHVHEAAVPAPGGEAQLLETAVGLHRRLLDRRHPLWELWFLTGLSEGRVGVLLKLHHAVADGLAAASLMGSLLAFAADDPDPDPAAWVPEPIPSTGSLVADNLAGRLRSAGRRAALLAHPGRMVEGLRLLTRALRRSLGAGRAPDPGLNRVVGEGRAVRFIRLDLGVLKQVARAHGGRVNDVVLALWAGGLRRLLLSRGQPVAGVEVVTGLAVALRTAAEADAGNQVGAIVVPLPVEEADAGRRLGLAIQAACRAKEEQDPAAIARLLVRWAATPLARRAMLRQHAVHVFASNLAGPPVPLYVLGARVLDVFPIGDLRGNIALFLTALSYDGRMYLAVTADAAGFPDLDVLMAGMEEDWLTLAGER